MHHRCLHQNYLFFLRFYKFCDRVKLQPRKCQAISTELSAIPVIHCLLLKVEPLKVEESFAQELLVDPER